VTTTESLLKQALEARVAAADLPSTPVLEVARNAARLRRRRARNAVVAAVAAAAAIGGPTALAVDWHTGADLPVASRPASDDGLLSQLPEGSAPAVGYLLGRTYVAADGSRTELDDTVGSVLDVAPYPDGLLVTTPSSSGGPDGIADQVRLGPDGQLEVRGCGGGELAVSGDGELVAHAYLDNGCGRWNSVVLAWGSTSRADAVVHDIVTPNGQQVEPIGVTADQVLYNALVPGDGAPEWRAYTTTELGPPVEVGGVARAEDWDPASGRVAGCTTDGRCVVVGEGGTVQLRLDEGEVPLAFSPDGRYLATRTPEDDATTTVTVRDSVTGDPVARLAGNAAAPSALSAAWEGSGHLLVAQVEGDQQALVRVGVDGTVELATTPTALAEGGYLLSAS
jgi:hypothetical protein